MEMRASEVDPRATVLCSSVEDARAFGRLYAPVVAQAAAQRVGRPSYNSEDLDILKGCGASAGERLFLENGLWNIHSFINAMKKAQ